MTYPLLQCALAAAVFTVAAVKVSGAQQPVTSPRAVSPMAPLDAHVTRHPKTKTSTARVKPATAAPRPGVAAAAPITAPVPALQRRPKPAPR
jgi:hypothetical protein